jgi:cysteinyl-tRNA synthetase
MTTVRLHNTATGRVEEFTPLEPGHVRMYTCGPTVHDFSHIGNFRTILFEDLLHRLLEIQGYKVTHVRNLTDVEDRIIRKSQEKGVDIDTYTAPYIAAFFEDLATLRVRPADVYPRATRHIKEMVALIERLKAGGHTYEVEGSHYFRIATFPKYGSLARLDPTKLKAGARVDVDEYGKDDPRDFALWKAHKPGEHSWPTPLGAGRPGWHIECSAMALAHLGSRFEIHGGGLDLIFPHHENEQAQSQAAGHPFADIWMHNGMLELAGEKMSKSLGNDETIAAVLNRWAPETLLILFLGAHWRSPVEFSDTTMAAAQARANTFRDGFYLTEPRPAPAEEWQRLADALNDNFNTPVALALAHEWIANGYHDVTRRFLALFGLERLAEREEPPADVAALAERRRAARQAKDFTTADDLRSQLEAKGWSVHDHAENRYTLVPTR